jgi:hypothetical protein
MRINNVKTMDLFKAQFNATNHTEVLTIRQSAIMSAISARL